MKDKIEQLVDFVQGRYLWQFHSRAWDREENIKGIICDTYEILANEKVERKTAFQKAFYADAKIFSEAIKEKFSWFMDLSNEEKKQVLDGVEARLIEITITKSKNEELKQPNY